MIKWKSLFSGTRYILKMIIISDNENDFFVLFIIQEYPLINGSKVKI